MKRPRSITNGKVCSSYYSYARDYFVKILWEHAEGQSVGLTYFKERGFDDPTIKKFELGYSLDSWDALYKDALDQKYQEDILEKAGLIIKKEGKIYDRFRGRVLFPIHNLTRKTHCLRSPGFNRG